MAFLRVLLALVLGRLLRGVSCAKCPGTVHVGGGGTAAIIPTGWSNEGGSGAEIEVIDGRLVIPHIGGRAYFADACTAGAYDHRQYAAYNLLGRTMRYTVDLNGAGCGCNAAMYLVSMRQNDDPSECSDYYCDANKVCGVSCAEIDIQEANQFSWHSTLHTATDKSGVGAGYGGGGENWNGPRSWTSAEYGPDGRCIDTTKPFDVAVSFPVDDQGSLTAMNVSLSQQGHSCPLSMHISKYIGMEELSAALSAGMTPVISYWSSDDMLWMDGKGKDGKGPCAEDHGSKCSDAIMFSSFSVDGSTAPGAPAGGAGRQPARCPGEVTVKVPVSQLPAFFGEGVEVTVLGGGVERPAEVAGIDWGGHPHNRSSSSTTPAPARAPPRDAGGPAAAPAPSPPDTEEGPHGHEGGSGGGPSWVLVALIVQSVLMCLLCIYAYILHKRTSGGAAANPPFDRTPVRKQLPQRSPTRNPLVNKDEWSPKEV